MDVSMMNNPFAVLTSVVAPAVLTNACSVLALGTANRIARVVDRSRELSAMVERLPSGHPGIVRLEAQLDGLGLRARKLFWALRLLYGALGFFASAALVAVVGSASAYLEEPWLFRAAAAVGLATGAAAVSGLVAGCVLMVQEVQLALGQIEEEARDALSTTRVSAADPQERPALIP